MPASGFGAVDFAVLVAYLAGTTALGVWLGRNQKNAQKYFVADRSLPWWAVMFSIVASETSALTFISIPGLAYAGNLGFLQVCAGYIVGRIVVARVLLPRYFDGNLVTAYTLLETRFGAETRRFASIVFMVTRAMADSVRVFATAIPIALIMGPVLPREYLMPAAILVLGALTIVVHLARRYARRGVDGTAAGRDIPDRRHLRGCAARPRGQRRVERDPRVRDGAGKLKAVSFYTGFDQPHTVFAGLIGGAFLAMASHGTDQLIVQRLLSARSLRMRSAP